MPVPGDSFRLFVYGTLMHDGRNHAPLRDQRFLGSVRTPPRYVLLVLDKHPGMIHAATNGRPVEGEMYEVSASLLPTLDAIEESPHYFRLEPVEIEGEPGPIFAYFFQQHRMNPIVYTEPRWHNRD